MSLTPDDDVDGESEEEIEGEIPAGVLRGIEDIDDEETVTKAELESILDS